MADHSRIREAFARLLARDATWRFLPILGPSETGKSHITNQMLANALRIPELACGRFDFKGTTDMDAEVRTFVQELGVPPPPANARLNERLGHILDALKQRARPAFLVFDTYEAAGKAQDWVEKQLLPSLILRHLASGGHRRATCARVRRCRLGFSGTRPAPACAPPTCGLVRVRQAVPPRFNAGEGGNRV